MSKIIALSIVLAFAATGQPVREKVGITILGESGGASIYELGPRTRGLKGADRAVADERIFFRSSAKERINGLAVGDAWETTLRGAKAYIVPLVRAPFKKGDAPGVNVPSLCVVLDDDSPDIICIIGHTGYGASEVAGGKNLKAFVEAKLPGHTVLSWRFDVGGATPLNLEAGRWIVKVRGPKGEEFELSVSSHTGVVRRGQGGPIA